jgi:hypothetical protein
VGSRQESTTLQSLASPASIQRPLAAGARSLNDIFSAVGQAAFALPGVLAFGVIMWWLVNAHSYLWRKVAATYPKRLPSRRIGKKFPDTIVITRRGASGPIFTGNAEYRQYTGAIIAVHDGSLSISLLPPFNIMCPKIEIPLDDMELSRTDWALWPDPYVIRMRNLASLDIIIGNDTRKWLKSTLDYVPFNTGS